MCWKSDFILSCYSIIEYYMYNLGSVLRFTSQYEEWSSFPIWRTHANKYRIKLIADNDWPTWGNEWHHDQHQTWWGCNYSTCIKHVHRDMCLFEVAELLMIGDDIQAFSILYPLEVLSKRNSKVFLLFRWFEIKKKSYNFRVFKTVQMVLSIADIMKTQIRQILVLYYQFSFWYYYSILY